MDIQLCVCVGAVSAGTLDKTYYIESRDYVTVRLTRVCICRTMSSLLRFYFGFILMKTLNKLQTRSRMDAVLYCLGLIRLRCYSFNIMCVMGMSCVFSLIQAG